MNSVGTIKYYWYALAIIIVLLDQLTKLWVQAEFDVWQRLNVLPVFDLTLVYNKGAAWSFLSNAGGWQRWFLTGISLVASVVLTVWIYRTPARQRLLLAALTFILGGAVGNLIDRALAGQVVDFLLFYYNDSYFPAFNLADSAITLGAFLMILDLFMERKDTVGEAG